MPPRPAAAVTLEARVEELTKDKTELKKAKVDLEAKLNIANGEVKRLRTARADHVAMLKDEIETSRSNLECAKHQLEASNKELVALNSANDTINTRVGCLLTEKDTLYHQLVRTQDDLREVKSELEKAKTDEEAEETLRQINGGFLKFAAALFVYCTAMSMLKVVDPKTNKHVEFFAKFNLGTLCCTVIFIFVFYCSKWEKKMVLVIFGLLAIAALVLSGELFYLQHNNLIST